MKGLRKLREVAGLTQAELEKMSGMDRTMLSLAENGLVTLRLEESEKLRLLLTRVIRKRVRDGQAVLRALEEEPAEATR